MVDEASFPARIKPSPDNKACLEIPGGISGKPDFDRRDNFFNRYPTMRLSRSSQGAYGEPSRSVVFFAASLGRLSLRWRRTSLQRSCGLLVASRPMNLHSTIVRSPSLSIMWSIAPSRPRPKPGRNVFGSANNDSDSWTKNSKSRPSSSTRSCLWSKRRSSGNEISKSDIASLAHCMLSVAENCMHAIRVILARLSPQRWRTPAARLWNWCTSSRRSIRW
jgi:hypothetical protein